MPSTGKNQKGPINRHSGYITPAFSGLPNVQQGENIRYGPQVGIVAISPLPSRGSPMPSKGRKSETANKWAQWLHHPCLPGAPRCPARGEHQIWPTSGHSRYITPAFLGLPNAKQGGKITKMAHMWGKWLHHPCLLGDPQCPARGENQKRPTSEHTGYITPAFLGIPNAQQGEKIRNGPQVGTLATSPLPSRGSPMPSTGEKSERSHKQAQFLHQPRHLGDPQRLARGEHRKWPTNGDSGYITPVFSGIPNAEHREKNKNGPHVGIVAASPLLSRGSPMPSTGRSSERARDSAWWLHHPCLLGDR